MPVLCTDGGHAVWCCTGDSGLRNVQEKALWIKGEETIRTKQMPNSSDMNDYRNIFFVCLFVSRGQEIDFLPPCLNGKIGTKKHCTLVLGIIGVSELAPGFHAHSYLGCFKTITTFSLCYLLFSLLPACVNFHVTQICGHGKLSRKISISS